jgi:fucose permease
MTVFVPLFLFTSLYAQISLGEDASGAGLYLLIFFGGFAAGSQYGGRILDSRGARASVIPGCALAAAGFFLWASKLTDFSLGDQWIYILMTGAGIGLVLSPASTDALNRAPSTAYGEATGILQTLRNFGSSLGLAILGTVLILETKAKLEGSLTGLGIPTERADAIADSLSQSGGGAASGAFSGLSGPRAERIFETVQHDYAQAMQVVFYSMGGVMVLCFVVAHLWLPRDRPSASAGSPG